MKLQTLPKSTYTLDRKSLQDIEYLSTYWQVPKTEVIRRCVRAEMERIVHKFNPFYLLELLDSSPDLLFSSKEISKMQKEISDSRKGWDR